MTLDTSHFERVAVRFPAMACDNREHVLSAAQPTCNGVSLVELVKR
jgi:hypothetical protein